MLIILAIILSIIEMLHNKALSSEIDNKDLIHKYQMPYRIYAGFSASLALSFYYGATVFKTVVGLGLYALTFWIAFDLLVNIFWLKTSPFHVGTTAETDIFFKKYSLIIKAILFITLLIFYYV